MRYFFLFITLIHLQPSVCQHEGDILLPHSLRLDNIAASWLGQPYCKASLEAAADSIVVVRTDGFDCYTLVELALATQVSRRFTCPLDLAVQALRYRHGICDGYGSRLHYFSEWLLQAEKEGYIRGITPTLTQKTVRKEISYMSAHPKAYPAKKIAVSLPLIRKTEKMLSDTLWHVVPRDDVHSAVKGVREGDIIALVSARTDLDVAHTGIAVKKNGVVHLLHASQNNNVVEISSLPLYQYVRNNKRFGGIMVWRPLAF